MLEEWASKKLGCHLVRFTEPAKKIKEGQIYGLGTASYWIDGEKSKNSQSEISKRNADSIVVKHKFKEC